MTLSMEFDSAALDESPLARFSWTRAVTQWSDEAGPKIREALKAEAPVSKTAGDSGHRPGRLRKSIRYERETIAGSVTLLFTAPVPYTPYVLGGTRPHVIAASAARALKFTGSDGQVYFRRSVNHPGTKPNPFNERAVLPLADELRATFQEAVQASMEGL